MPTRHSSEPSSAVDAVDVIIPCRDAGGMLSETLESLSRQTLPPRRILVVDDGSTDPETKAVLERLESPIEVIPGRAAGPGAARNAGFARSTAAFLLVLDADDQVAPSFLERTLAALRARPECGFAYTDLEYFGERRGVHRQHPYNFHDQLFRNQVTTCALVRREAWSEAGGYSEEMTFGGEDWDFFVSLGAAGWHGVHVPEVLFRYRVRTGSLSTQTRRSLPEIADYVRSRHPQLYTRESIAGLRREWKGTWSADDPDSIPFRVQRLLREPDRPRVIREAMERRGLGAVSQRLARPWALFRNFRERGRTRGESWRPQGDPQRRRQFAVDGFRAHAPSEPVISVIVTCRDDGEFLPDMLGSLFRQTQPDFELIVVDDGSREAGTVRLLEELAESAGPGARVVRRARSGGLAAARNDGVARGHARLVACVDADDILDERFLEATAARLHREPSLGYAYFDYRKFGTVEDLVLAPDFDLRALLRDNFVPACAPFRREAWAAVGGYDEAMSGGFEDWEFWLRLAEAGWMGDHIPATLFYYRRRHGSLVEGAIRDKARWVDYIRERHADLFERLEADPGAGT